MNSLCQDGNYLDLRVSGMSPNLLTPEAGLILSGRATCSCVYLDWPLTDSVREWWYEFLTSDQNSIAYSGEKQNQAYPVIGCFCYDSRGDGVEQLCAYPHSLVDRATH